MNRTDRVVMGWEIIVTRNGKTVEVERGFKTPVSTKRRYDAMKRKYKKSAGYVVTVKYHGEDELTGKKITRDATFAFNRKW